MTFFLKRILMVATVAAALPVMAQEQAPTSADSIGKTIRVDQLENRLAALEQKLFAIPARRPVTGELAGDINTMVADMEARVTQLEEEWQRLYGSVEQLGHSLSKLSEKIDAFSSDVSFRLDELERGMAAAPKAAPAAENLAEKPMAEAQTEMSKTEAVSAVKKAQTNVPSDLTPEDLYKKAYDYLSAASYDDARAYFETFIERHGKHQLADNAYYWLGEVHLVQNAPAQAVVAFTNGMKAFPKGAKASANLLKMGVAFERMGQAKFAKSSWEKLVKDFPDSPEAGKAKEMLEKLVE